MVSEPHTPTPEDEDEGADAANALDDGTQGKGPFKPPDQVDLTEDVRGRCCLSFLASFIVLICLFLAAKNNLGQFLLFFT